MKYHVFLDSVQLLNQDGKPDISREDIDSLPVCQESKDWIHAEMDIDEQDEELDPAFPSIIQLNDTSDGRKPMMSKSVADKVTAFHAEW